MLTFIRTSLAYVRASEDNEKGATAVEYGLMVALIAAVIAVVVFALGTTLSGKFSHVNDCVGNTTTANCTNNNAPAN